MLSENTFSQNVCPPIFVTQICAPNIYDKSTPVDISFEWWIEWACEYVQFKFDVILYKNKF